MQLDRIEDFIINGEGLDFNFYSQRKFIPPKTSDRIELGDYLLYVAIKFYNYDICKMFSKHKIIIDKFPKNALKNSNSFAEAKNEINKFKNELSKYIFYNKDLKANGTYKDLFERGEFFLAAGISGIGGGDKFYSHILTNKDRNHSHRLYIPCNSEHCYKMARLIIEKSITYNLPFEFKIMNVEKYQNGADNIVMYIEGENFTKYINMLNEIIDENPDITFCKNHMFGYSINQYIALAPELGGYNSFSGHMKHLLEKAISKYGRTNQCVKFVQDYVLEIFNDWGIIESMERIFEQKKIK